MKILIAYYSKTGFTQRYAQWLAEDIHCDCLPLHDIKTVNHYDIVIFASWLHAGKIQKLDWYRKLNTQKRIILLTGACPMGVPTVEETIQNNISEKDYHVFYVTGGLNYEKMGFGDRLMMKVFSKMLKNQKNPDDMTKEMIKTIDHSFDNSHRDYLKDIENFIQNNY